MKNLSLRTVVISGVIAGLVVPMSVGTFYALTQQNTRLLAETHEAHKSITTMTALGVQKALWDLSQEGAAPLVQSALDDTRVVSVSIYDNKKELFYEAKNEQRRLGDIVNLELPIKNGDETIGSAKVEFSMASVAAQVRARMIEALLLAIVQAVACISVLVVLLNRRVLARIDLIKGQAEMIASKQLDSPFTWSDGDEISRLGQALETTRGSLKALFAELERKNIDLASINGNLEKIVAERTATIKMILDNVRSGFLLVDQSLSVQPGYTKSCESLLNQPELVGKPLQNILGLSNRAFDHFKCCFEQVFDDFLPEEVSLDQLASRFKIGGRTISLEGSTVRDKTGKVISLLLTIVDVSLLDAAEKENRANRAMVKIMQNISAFHDFIQDSRARIGSSLLALKEGKDAVVRRELHTLKGNSSAFGLDDIAHLIHQVEDQVTINDLFIGQVQESFGKFLDANFELLKVKFDQDPKPSFNIAEYNLEALQERVSTLNSVDAIRSAVTGWSADIRKISAMELLGALPDYVGKLAKARCKNVTFKVVGGETRLERSVFKDIAQNLVHLVRNSIDHGIEVEEERGTKKPAAEITVAFTSAEGNVQIEVYDDGRGIDVSKVCEKAIRLGKISQDALGKMNNNERLSLIFMDGLSTADSVSDTSGRGVGMTAVKAAVESAGGQIHIETKIGHGTKFRLVIPTSQQIVRPAKHAA